MVSKLSVISKLRRFPNFNQNGFTHLLEHEYGSIRNLFTKNQRIELAFHQPNVFAPKTAENVKSFKITSNMSSNSKEGNGKNSKKALNKKKLLRMRKRRSLRTIKLKDVNNSVGNNKSSETKANYNDAGALKSETNTDQVLNFKRKQVHVEFMESQNLKDFNLHKSQSPRNSFNNLQQSDNLVTPSTSHYDQNHLHKNEEKSLIILKSQEPKQADSAIQTIQIEGSSRTNDLRGRGRGAGSTASDKQVLKGYDVNWTKGHLKKFWWNFSLTVLSLILVFTGYALSNLATPEALKMIKKELVPLKTLHSSYEKHPKNEQLDLNEINSSGDANEKNDDDLIGNEGENVEFLTLLF